MQKLLYSATVAGTCVLSASLAQAQCACGSGYYGYGPAAYYGSYYGYATLPTYYGYAAPVSSDTYPVYDGYGGYYGSGGYGYGVAAVRVRRGVYGYGTGVVWAASAMDIAQSASAVSGGAVATAIVLLARVE